MQTGGALQSLIWFVLRAAYRLPAMLASLFPVEILYRLSSEIQLGCQHRDQRLQSRRCTRGYAQYTDSKSVDLFPVHAVRMQFPPPLGSSQEFEIRNLRVDRVVAAAELTPCPSHRVPRPRSRKPWSRTPTCTFEAIERGRPISYAMKASLVSIARRQRLHKMQVKGRTVRGTAADFVFARSRD